VSTLPKPPGPNELPGNPLDLLESAAKVIIEGLGDVADAVMAPFLGRTPSGQPALIVPYTQAIPDTPEDVGQVVS
jgi:hypothetical protein